MADTFTELQFAKTRYYDALSAAEHAWHRYAYQVTEDETLDQVAIDKFAEYCEGLDRYKDECYNRLGLAHKAHREAHADIMAGL